MAETAQVDPILLIFTIAAFLVLVAANLVFLAYYSHHADQTSLTLKIVLVSQSVVKQFRCWATY